MKQSCQSKVKLKSIFRWLLLGLCGTILGINVYLANANGIAGNRLPMPFEHGAAVVLSGSMEPKIYEGDLIIVRKMSDYRERNIVVYQAGNSLVVHRIVKKDGNMITTKGDANNTDDAPINISAIKGKVVLIVPKIGRIVGFFKTPLGIICIIAAAIALLEIPRRDEKKRDDEIRRKIIDEIELLKKEKQ